MRRAGRLPEERRRALSRPLGLTIGTASVLTALLPFTVDAYTPGLPAMAVDLAASDSLIQLTLTAALLGLLVGQAFTGVISDRLGRRPPLVVGLVLFVVAAVLCLVAPSVPVLIVGRFLQGIGAGAALSTSRVIGRDLLEGHSLAAYYSRLTALTAVAAVVGPLTAGFLLDLTESWRPAFWVVGGLGAIVLALVIIALPETRATVSRGSPSGASRGGVAAVLRQPQVAVSILLMACTSAILLTYLAGGSFILQNRYGLSPIAFSVVFAVVSVGLVICSQLNGLLARRRHPAALATAGLVALLTAAAGLAVAFLVSAPVWVVIGGMFALVSVFGFAVPNLMTMAMTVERSRAGTAAALLGVAQFSIGSLTVPLVGVPVDGPIPMMSYVLLFYTATAVVIVLVARRMLLTRVPWDARRTAPLRTAAPQLGLPGADPAPGD
ncbi:MAG: drug resistance transporter, Bcr/CflA subfamily [Naasia sp.]|nr:drug resistance transporter, Bcr/CflA subfamily [Naasia sp.]